ncbi:MAG: hypothetical protein ACLRR3_01880 [Eubacterium sp.]
MTVAKIKNYKGINLKTVPTINCKGLAAMSASVFAGIKASMGRYDIVRFHAEGPCAMLWLPNYLARDAQQQLTAWTIRELSGASLQGLT